MGSWVLALALGGCAGGQAVRVDDERLSRLPADQRVALIDEERNLRVAEVNVDAARAALRDAQLFRQMVASEHSAARERHAAARDGVKLAGRAADTTMHAHATRSEKLAQRTLVTIEAKARYAEELERLRAAEVAETEAEAELARARLELDKVGRLRAAGQASGLQVGPFERSARDAALRVERKRQEIARLRAAAGDARGVWRERRRDLAAGGGDSSLDAPLPPERIRVR
jgi:hypothetical protein